MLRQISIQSRCTFFFFFFYEWEHIIRSDVLRKKIICRDKTGFDAEKFIEDSKVKIRSEDVRCEWTPKHTKWKS